MASKKTLNAKNLEALGAQLLAELLIEISTGDAAAKRRLRFELANAQSPAEVGSEVRKQLATIGQSHSFVDWHKRKELVDDLEAQRRAIVEKVAKHDASEALELMWRFMALASSIFERCDDSSGTVIGFFHSACEDLGEIATAANADPVNLVMVRERFPPSSQLLLIVYERSHRIGASALLKRLATHAVIAHDRHHRDDRPDAGAVDRNDDGVVKDATSPSFAVRWLWGFGWFRWRSVRIAE